MNKPVLLLVDDDRAVLDALEAELTPAFAELCRIEAFDDARAVLEALPRWTEERRSIAVAIVDQKMPGMTGVELLSAMRASVREADEQTADATGSREQPFHPARHNRAILLTGYAGLESAMAAKNEGGAGRYLEKPWLSRELSSIVNGALAKSANDAGAARYFIFRELDTAEEAGEAMSLRYEVYARTAGIVHVLPENPECRRDVDGYDRHARLFGLFEHGTSEPQLVGTIRVVGDAPAPLAPMLEALFQPGTALGERLREPRAHALPMLEYLLDGEAVNTLRARLLAAGEQVVEPGRLALAPSHREGGAVGARHLARHIIEGSVSFFFFYRIENAVLTCVPPHDAFYRPYGFVPAEGTTSKHTPELGTVVACLHGSIDRVPAAARARCDEIAKRLALAEGGGGGLVSARTTPPASAARMAARTSRQATCTARRSRWQSRASELSTGVPRS